MTDTTETIPAINLKKLIEQRHALDEQINELHKVQKVKAINDIKNLVAEYSVTPDEIFGSRKQQSLSQGANQKAKVAVKFRNNETGEAWTGRGKAPKWIAGKDREPFRVPEAQETPEASENTPAAE